MKKMSTSKLDVLILRGEKQDVKIMKMIVFLFFLVDSLYFLDFLFLRRREKREIERTMKNKQQSC